MLSKFSLRCLHNQRALFAVSLLFMIALVSSCFVFAFSGVSSFVSGAPDKVIENETELRNAISSAVGPVVIALGNDITLTESLVIPTNKDITLISDSNSEFFKLIRGIIVEGGGVLRLDGIIVTNYADESGIGVYINSGGTFIMYSGEISGNIRASGGGVSNAGTFEMVGGVISGNRGIVGGGVCNTGTFTMSGGKIFNNDAHFGGGVVNYGVFNMVGGVISGNNGGADGGGGVYNGGSFEMSGGEISNNTAGVGGGVFNDDRNTAGVVGGVFNDCIFSLSGGEISNNTAKAGGGVYIYNGNFSMFSGTISNNKAEFDGGGVCNRYGILELVNGVISNNTASNNGGGIGVFDFVDLERVFIGDDVVFSGNSASAAYNRNFVHDSLYNSHIGRNVVWSTPFTQGYNNYDISYTNGVPITTPEPSNPPTTSEPTNPPITPEPSNPPTTPDLTIPPTNLPTSSQLSGDGGTSIVTGFRVREVIVKCVIVILMAIFVATILVFSFRKRESK